VTKTAVQTRRYEYTVAVRDTEGVDHDVTYIVAPPWEHPDRYNPPATIRSPDYSKLPPQMRLKAGIDPLPPTRRLGQEGSFYQSSLPCEYIVDLNSIIEDVDPDPLVPREVAVLDTLYEASSVLLLTYPNPAPTMTYYHGTTAHQFVFSGFSIWSYARQDCMALVDFVLQDLWGMTRENIDRGSIAPAVRNGVARPGRVVTPAQRAVSARR
jgi:hypothetical protein